MMHLITNWENAQKDSTSYITRKKNHLFYMDKIKLFARNEEDLEVLIMAMEIVRK